MAKFSLTGPRADNPLGFLTALGALVTLEDAGHPALLGWDGVSPKLFVSLESRTNESLTTEEDRRQSLVSVLHRLLCAERRAGAAETAQAKAAMEEAKTALKKKRDDIKKQKLSREVRARELEPLEVALREKSECFKRLLSESAPDKRVTLGKNLTESSGSFILHILQASKQCRPGDRRWVDMTAAYGVADSARPSDRMLATPWALVNGSGHQDFLSSVQELMVQCTSSHVNAALFGPWEPNDEKYSLRLDATDDRRYALMDRDPSPNKPRTLWGANRLAFEALSLFPAVPIKGGMGVCAWRRQQDWQTGCRVRWPLWDQPVGPAVIRSLLALRDLWLDEAPARLRLQGLGVRAVMESRRVAVGAGPNVKYNVTPAAPVWTLLRSGELD